MAKIRFQQGDISAQANPPVGQFIVMYDTDGKLKQKDSDGVITEISGNNTPVVGGSLKKSYKMAMPDNLTAGDTNQYVIKDVIKDATNPLTFNGFELKYLDDNDVMQPIPFIEGNTYHATINGIRLMNNGVVRANSTISTLYSITDFANTVGNFNVGSGLTEYRNAGSIMAALAVTYPGTPQIWVVAREFDNLTFQYKGLTPQGFYVVDNLGNSLSIPNGVLSTVVGVEYILNTPSDNYVFVSTRGAFYPFSNVYKLNSSDRDFTAGFSAYMGAGIPVGTVGNFSKISAMALSANGDNLMLLGEWLDNSGYYISSGLRMLNATTGALIADISIPNIKTGNQRQYPRSYKIINLEERWLIFSTGADGNELFSYEWTGGSNWTNHTTTTISNLEEQGLYISSFIDLIRDSYSNNSFVVSLNTNDKIATILKDGNMSTLNSTKPNLGFDSFIMKLLSSSHFLQNTHPNLGQGAEIGYLNPTDSMNLSNNLYSNDYRGSNLKVIKVSDYIVVLNPKAVYGKELSLYKGGIDQTLTSIPQKFLESTVSLKTELQTTDSTSTELMKLGVNDDNNLTVYVNYPGINQLLLDIEILESLGEYAPNSLASS